MLNRRPSLKLRAAAIFVAVFATVFVAGFVLFSWRSLAAGGERHHAGPTIALSLAADAVRLHGDTLVLPDDGALADIARANPHFWLFADIAGHHYRHGDVPAAAERLLVGDGSGLGIARFHVRGIDRPLSDASVVRQGGALFAAGGIDPSTITLAHALHYLFREGLLLIVVGVGVEAFDPIGDFVARGQHDDRRRRRPRLRDGHQPQPVAVRKPAVEQDHAVVGAQRRAERVLEAADAVHDPAFAFERARDRRRQRRLVLDQQDAHAVFHRGIVAAKACRSLARPGIACQVAASVRGHHVDVRNDPR